MAQLAVTGARGFVGSVFTKRARDKGHHVIALDNYSRGENDIFCTLWDCRDGIPVGCDVDAVVHLAAATGDLAKPLEELREANVTMLQKVCASTKAPVYWPTTSLALGVPDSGYVISKEEALAWARDQEQVHPLRFFNVTGAYHGLTERRKNEVHVIPTLVDCALRGKAFTVNGSDYDTQDGTPSRDFVNVLDVVDGILAMIDGGWYIPHRDGCFWFGTGTSTTIKQLVEISGLQVETVLGPRRSLDTGALDCDPGQVRQFEALIDRPLTHSVRSIRDEVNALVNTPVRGAA